MAITTVGFDGTITEAQWSRFHSRESEVISGGVVSPASGRAVSVSPIDAVAAGVWFMSDAAETVPVAANGTNTNRVDYVVAEGNWSSNTVAFRTVTGSSANPPALVQNAGSLWQMPLARVTVAPGALTVPAGNIELCKPLPRAVQSYSGNMDGITYTGAGTNGASIGPVINIDDPGWPYRLDFTCSLYARPATVNQRVRIEVLSGSTVLAYGISGPTDVHQQIWASAKPTRVFAGRQSLSLKFYSHDANGTVYLGGSVSNVFDVHVVPA